MGLTSGAKLGPYEIVSPLGAGGMGEVYRARDTRLDRTVAIKILPEHLSSNLAAKQRFEREARAISSLNHPNICTLHDVARRRVTRTEVGSRATQKSSTHCRPYSYNSAAGCPEFVDATVKSPLAEITGQPAVRTKWSARRRARAGSGLPPRPRTRRAELTLPWEQ